MHVWSSHIARVRINRVSLQFRDGVRLFIENRHHMPSGQSRVYRVTQLHTDVVRCREAAGNGSVVLKVVPVTRAALAGHHGPINACLSFPTPTITGMKWACWKCQRLYASCGRQGNTAPCRFNSNYCSTRALLQLVTTVATIYIAVYFFAPNESQVLTARCVYFSFSS